MSQNKFNAYNNHVTPLIQDIQSTAKFRVQGDQEEPTSEKSLGEDQEEKITRFKGQISQEVNEDQLETDLVEFIPSKLPHHTIQKDQNNQQQNMSKNLSIEDIKVSYDNIFSIKNHLNLSLAEPSQNCYDIDLVESDQDISQNLGENEDLQQMQIQEQIYQDERGSLSVILKFNLESEKPAQIILNEKDNPELVMQKFQQSHSLNPQKQLILKQFVNNIIQDLQQLHQEKKMKDEKSQMDIKLNHIRKSRDNYRSISQQLQLLDLFGSNNSFKFEKEVEKKSSIHQKILNSEQTQSKQNQDYQVENRRPCNNVAFKIKNQKYQSVDCSPERKDQALLKNKANLNQELISSLYNQSQTRRKNLEIKIKQLQEKMQGNQYQENTAQANKNTSEASNQQKQIKFQEIFNELYQNTCSIKQDILQRKMLKLHKQSANQQQIPQINKRIQQLQKLTSQIRSQKIFNIQKSEGQVRKQKKQQLIDNLITSLKIKPPFKMREKQIELQKNYNTVNRSFQLQNWKEKQLQKKQRVQDQKIKIGKLIDDNLIKTRFKQLKSKTQQSSPVKIPPQQICQNKNIEIEKKHKEFKQSDKHKDTQGGNNINYLANQMQNQRIKDLFQTLDINKQEKISHKNFGIQKLNVDQKRIMSDLIQKMEKDQNLQISFSDFNLYIEELLKVSQLKVQKLQQNEILSLFINSEQSSINLETFQRNYQSQKHQVKRKSYSQNLDNQQYLQSRIQRKSPIQLENGQRVKKQMASSYNQITFGDVNNQQL